MEKFSNWRDKGTGISPFLPTVVQTSSIRKFVVNPAVVAVKWPLFALLYLLVSVAPKPATRLIFSWLFSIADIDLSVEGVRKSNTKEIDAQRPSSGEIVVSNLVSPLDIFTIFLLSKVRSLSSIVVLIPWKTDLYKFTVWESLSLFFLPLESSISQGTKLEGNYQNALNGKLAVVFAEGTPSNNKAILPLQQQCAQLWSGLSIPVKVAVLRYYPSTISLPVPHVTRSQYLSKLFTLPGKAYIKVKIVPVKLPSLKMCQAAFVENGLNQVELGVQEKIEFFKYFQNYSVDQKKKMVV
ncbi:hypothetical protein OXX79_002323 [Metschnikowia pulcherrima]